MVVVLPLPALVSITAEAFAPPHRSHVRKLSCVSCCVFLLPVNLIASAVLVIIMVLTKQLPPTVLVIILVVVLVIGIVVSSFAKRRPAYIRHLFV